MRLDRPPQQQRQMRIGPVVAAVGRKHGRRKRQPAVAWHPLGRGGQLRADLQVGFPLGEIGKHRYRLGRHITRVAQEPHQPPPQPGICRSCHRPQQLHIRSKRLASCQPGEGPELFQPEHLTTDQPFPQSRRGGRRGPCHQLLHRGKPKKPAGVVKEPKQLRVIERPQVKLPPRGERV